MKGLHNSRFRSKFTSQGRIDRSWQGFTIVELLIVVVVIAILAAITIVAYNGITAQARDSSLKADLTNGAKQLHLARVDNGSFPTSKPSYLGAGIQYSGGGNEFCITSSSEGRAFHMRQSGGVQDGACSGHTVIGGGSGSPMATTMQTFTQSHCSSLPIYNGSNEEAVVSLTDSRGGSTQTYQVARLPGDQCWMLTNLKLGSASGAITLTPADSNVASNFTLPQLNNGSRDIIWSGTGNDFDTPYAYGPLEEYGDTGSGATNYGYLYNWPAATAGQSTSFTTGNAPHSICPAGWRLPTGGSPSSDFGQLDVAFDGTGTFASGSPSIAKWQPTGPFKGSFSGRWYDDGFGAQGDAGILWSASAYPDSPDSAFYAGFDPSLVFPGDGNFDRYFGIGVRCLLN